MADHEDPTFTDLAQSLFSPEEMQELMRSEVERARRYGFALTLFLVGVDRLDALHDLYGVSSKSEILMAVLRHLRRHVRSSDMVASLEGDRLLLLSPYADRVGSKRLAQRMLDGARKLEFAGDNRSLRVTLSMGMAHSDAPDLESRESLFRAADDAQRLAQRNGGDRVVEIDVLSGAPPMRGQRDSRGSRQPQPQGESVSEPASDAEAPSLANPLAGLRPEDVVEVVRDALAQLGVSPDRLAGDQAPAATSSSESSHPDLQGRRIAKLSAAVEGLQQQLASMSAQGAGAEAGVASLGKVFGALGEGGEGDQKRKDLMGALFKANLSLQKRRGSVEGEQ